MSLSEILHRRFLEEFDKYMASSDGSPNWVPNGGTWTVVSEEYRAQLTTAGDKSVRQNRALTGDLVLDDLRAEFKVKYVTAWEQAFFFRGESGNEANNRYEVKLWSGGLVLRKVVSGTPSALASYSFSPSLNTQYTIQIHCKDTLQGDVRIQVSLDGTPRIDQTDSTDPFIKGTIGFICTTTTTTDVYWDDVDCWSLERYVDDILVKNSIGDRIRRFELGLFNPEGIRSGQYALGDEIEVWRGTTLTRIFRGNVEYDKAESAKGQRIELKGRDYTARLLTVFCFKTYTSQEIATIYKDLLTTYAPDFGQSNIQNTGISLAPVYKMRRLFLLGRELADIADFETWADFEKEIYFRPRTYEDSGVVFTPSTNLLDYKFPREGQTQITKITVYGKQGIVVQVENRVLREQLGYDREGTPIVDPAIQTTAEAKARGKAYLAKHSGPLIGQLFTYAGETLNVGQLCKVTIPKEKIDAEFLILGIDYKSPHMPETIITVAEYATGIEEIIAALRADADILLSTEADLEATIERWLEFSDSEVVDDTKLTISKKTVSDEFILGHITFGKLGAQGYGLGTRSGEWVKIYEEDNP